MLAVLLAIFTQWENQRLGMVRNLLGVGKKTSRHHRIRFPESPASASGTVLLKPNEQLFQNKWHPLFIASLVWNDHSLQIWIDKVSKITPEQLVKADYIISLTEFEARVLQSSKSEETK